MRLVVRNQILFYLIGILDRFGHLLYFFFFDFSLFYIGKDSFLISWEDEHPSHVLILELGQQVVSLNLVPIFQFCNLGNLQLVFGFVDLEFLKTLVDAWMFGFNFLKFSILTLEFQNSSTKQTDFLSQFFINFWKIEIFFLWTFLGFFFIKIGF